MATVKILHDGVGNYNAGDIVPNAPEGLIEMAEQGTINAATGLALVEFLDEDLGDEFERLKARAKELKIKGFGSMKFETLKETVAAAETNLANQQQGKGDTDAKSDSK